MDKNTLTGFALMALVLIGFSYLNSPSEAEIRNAQMQDSIRIEKEKEALMLESSRKEAEMEKERQRIELLRNDTNSIFHTTEKAEEKVLTMENNLVKYSINTKGGRICAAQVKGYKMQDRTTDVTLFQDKADRISFSLPLKEDNLVTEDMVFIEKESTDSTLVLSLPVGTGSLELTYKLLAESYMMNLSIKAVGIDKYLLPTTKDMNVSLHGKVRQLEKGFTFENRYSTLTYKEAEGGTDYLKQTGNDDEKPEEKLSWLAFKNQFFSTAFIAADNFSDVSLESVSLNEGSGYLKEYDAVATVPFDIKGENPTQIQFYFGPNHYKILQASDNLSIGDKDLDLEELVDLGWPLFRWINRFFTLYIFDWLKGFGMNMGIVLFIMTLIINAIVYYPRKKSFMASAKMRVLKPQIEKINAKYPNQEDQMKKQQEIMQLYSQYGVSPMGGCLPMLIQMPIFIAMFNFVPNAIELRQQSFLFADDLSTYDDVISWGKDIWLLGDHLSIFCVGFCAVNILSSMISMKQQDNGSNPQMASMKWMMYIMPVMFFFWFNDYSSGLCWYYFVSGIVGAAIMWGLKLTTNDEKLLEKMERRRAERKQSMGKTSNIMGRYAKLAEMAEEMKKQQEQNRK